MTALSAVVVLHDSARDVARLLDSLAVHVAPRCEALQVVCVDTASTDDGAAVAAARGAEVVALGANPGFGAANNAGLARAEHAVAVLINPDVLALDDDLVALARHAVAHDALHVPRLLNDDGSVQRSAHPAPGTVRALLPAAVPPPLLPRRAREHAEPWRARTTRPVGWAIAACVAARTQTLRDLGPFDPAQFLFYEDLDLALRAAATGVPTILHPELRLVHTGGHSTTKAYADEPHALQAHRRRAVVGARLGRRALVLDDAAQALTFASRAAARAVLRRDAARERAQVVALRRARRR